MSIYLYSSFFFFFFFNDTATTEIYTLSLHDALPISSLTSSAPIFSQGSSSSISLAIDTPSLVMVGANCSLVDRKSTRLNSSHVEISYAVFCLKKKNKKKYNQQQIEQTTLKNLRYIYV